MTTTELALPTSVNPQTWNADTAALMEFAGLTWMQQQGAEKVRMFAPPGIVAAFIQACSRTGLDPTAKQIYAMEMGGKWTVVVGVDGMRVVAQRSGQYEGQTPIEWTADGVTWVQAWLSSEKPAAARVGVLRKGFREPLYQVVTWQEFGKTTGQWKTMPAHMLGIRAETHGLRRAFPNDMSGLYTAEDLESDSVDTRDAYVLEPTEDWAALVTAAQSREEVIEIMKRATAAGEVNDQLRTQALTKIGLYSRGEADKPTEPDAAPVDEPNTDYDAEAEAFERAEAARFEAGEQP